MIDPLPLIIGVTGHRDLLASELPAIEAQVEAFITKLQSDYPDLPLFLLTALAEGADALVARVAAKFNVRVLAVLPMNAASYREDFSGAGRDLFDAQAERFEVMELQHGDRAPDMDDLQWRKLQYERLGVFLAAHCHLLLAIWDGKSVDKKGGTSQVVKFHQRDITTLANPGQERPQLDTSEDESDLVHHIVCSRNESGPPAEGLTPGQAFWVTRDDQQPRSSAMPPRYGQVFQRMVEFNQDLRSVRHLPSAQNLGEPVHAAPDVERSATIRSAFERCDLLATYYQRRTRWALNTTLGGALAAGFSFILYADLEGVPGAIFAYFLFIFIALGGSFIARSRGWQRRYVDYRVLAEGLRVQYYWSLAGVAMDNPSRFSHDRFFSGRDLDLGWIRNILRFTGLRPDRELTTTSEQIATVVRDWIGTEFTGQLGYYKKGAVAKLKQHIYTSRITVACLLAGLSAAALLALATSDFPPLVSNLLVALMGLLPLLAAARQNYAHRVAERELVAQYAQMHRVFGLASRLLTPMPSVQRAQQILYEVGEAVLNENAQWVLRQRERPLPGSDAMS